MSSARVERRSQTSDKLLIRRVQDSLTKCGLNRTERTSVGGNTVHTPRVVSADARPPGWVQIDLLPGQSAEDFAAYAPAIAQHLGVPHIWVVPLGRSRIRLELPARHESS
jgi:hypothetical protein